MTKEQKSKLFRHLFQVIFSVPDVASLPEQVRATIGRPEGEEKIYFTRVDHPKLRGYECALPGKHVYIMEQNPAKSSKAARIAKKGYRCAWIWIQKEPYPRLERQWLAFMVKRNDDVVCIFAGKHIMTRVYDHLTAQYKETR